MRNLNKFGLAKNLKKAKSVNAAVPNLPNIPANQLSMFNKMKELGAYMLYACGDWSGNASDPLKDWGTAGLDLTVNESNNLPTVFTQGNFKGLRSPPATSSGKGFKRSNVNILANETVPGSGLVSAKTIVSLVYNETQNGTQKSIFGVRNPASVTGALFLMNQNTVSSLTFYNGSSFVTYAPVNNALVAQGRWYLAVHRIDSNGQNHFINGTTVTNNTASTVTQNTARTDFYLLTMPGFGQFYGVVANVGIFNKSLTDQEILDIYNSIGINLNA